MVVLGIDLGTSATKALVVDAAGTVCGVGHGDHRPLVPRGGRTSNVSRSASCLYKAAFFSDLASRLRMTVGR